MKWQVVFAKHALKDATRLSAAGLRQRAEQLLEILSQDPFQNPPPFEKLVGDPDGAYSRRINIQHQLAYEFSRRSAQSVSFGCGATTNDAGTRDCPILDELAQENLPPRA